MECSGNCSTCNTNLDIFNEFKNRFKAIDDFTYSFEEHSQPKTMLLGLTNRCNLSCPYCFVDQNSQDMTYEIAEQAIQWLISNKNNKKMQVNFFGGEPLLKFDDIIKPIVEKYYKDINFGITTNGMLLTEDVVDFLYQHNMSVLLSFDGIEQVQNTQRPAKNGDSFKQILNNIPYFLVRYPQATMRATITKNSIPYLYDSMLMAEELGFAKIVFCPNAYENWSVEEANNLFEQFNKIGLYIYKKLRNKEPVIEVDPIVSYYSSLTQAIKNNLYFDNNIMRCGLGTVTCAITPTGDIIPCQEKTSNPTVILGNIYDGINPKKHEAFLRDYFNKINNLECNEFCGAKAKLICLSDTCPSRFEDMQYKMSSAKCIFIQTAVKVISRLHLLCSNSGNMNIRNYFKEGE